MRGIGERACDRLIERIVEPGLRPEVELLPTELVIRSSCGCPPGTVTRRSVVPIVPIVPVAQTDPHAPARHPTARHPTAKHPTAKPPTARRPTANDQTTNNPKKER
jgi:hypothetical protein